MLWLEKLVCIILGVFLGGLVLGISCAFSGVNVELGALEHRMIPGLDGNSFQGGKEDSKCPVLLLYGKPMWKGKKCPNSVYCFFAWCKIAQCLHELLVGYGLDSFQRNWHNSGYALQSFQNILKALRDGHGVFGVFFAFWSFRIVKPLKNAIYPGNSMSRIHPLPWFPTGRTTITTEAKFY